MPSRILEIADEFVAALREIEPATYTGAQCARIVEQLARVERVCTAVRTAAAKRAVDCGAHREQGFTNASEWLGRAVGTTSTEAERSLKTIEQLDDFAVTLDAVRNGDVSLQQAHEIAHTASACPGTEEEMLERAKSQSLHRLRDDGRRKRLSAVDPDELYRRQRNARHHRHWRDETGMVRYSGALPPDVGVPLMNRLDVETDRQWRKARRDGGEMEPRERYAADAFVQRMEGNGKRHATRADVVYVCDVTTGDSHIVGGGPVPSSVVREAAREGFIKAVLHDGTKVDTIVHYGQHIPAALRTVIELGDPPEFDGVTCVDCSQPFRFEWDHDNPRANGGLTMRSNFRPRCRPCHQIKTEQDRLAGLLRRRAP